MKKRNTIGQPDLCELKLQKLLKTDLVLPYVLIAFLNVHFSCISAKSAPNKCKK